MLALRGATARCDVRARAARRACCAASPAARPACHSKPRAAWLALGASRPRTACPHARGRVLAPTAQLESGPCPIGELVVEKPGARVGYRVERVLGVGSSSHTYVCTVEALPRAADAPDLGDEEALRAVGDRVALKAMSLRGQGRWKPVELFEREAKLLRSLTHPGVPSFVDAFNLDTPTDRTYTLVQRLAPGETLQALVDSGAWRPDEAEIEGIAAGLLDILSYLHGLRPPVVHRDIKPANVVYDVRSKRVTLVDFGAVRGFAGDDGSTQIGTFGFMAPEQFMGRATERSDLYSLGTLLLFLLTGRPPGELPSRDLRLDWEGAVTAGPRLRALLRGLVQPEASARVAGAEDALTLLRDGGSVTMLRGGPDVALAAQRRRPAGSRVVLQRDGTESLVVNVPAGAANAEVYFLGGFCALWFTFIALWTGMVVFSGAPIIIAAFSLPFWGAGALMLSFVLRQVSLSTRLELRRDTWRLQSTVLGVPLRARTGATEDLDEARARTGPTDASNRDPQSCLELKEGVAKHNLGESLDLVENEWLAGEVNAFLRDARAQDQS